MSAKKWPEVITPKSPNTHQHPEFGMLAGGQDGDEGPMGPPGQSGTAGAVGEQGIPGIRGEDGDDGWSIPIVTTQGAAIANATGGATIDTEARATLNTLLAQLRAWGMLAT